MTLELSRPVQVERAPESVLVEANAAECAALAGRLQVIEVRALRCRFGLRRQGAVVMSEGVLAAEVVQACVVTLEPVEQRVEERFTVHFVPEGQEGDDGDPEAPDEIPYAGGMIDLGEAAAEQLALALDPYPRAPGAVLEMEEEPEAAPFAALAAFRRER